MVTDRRQITVEEIMRARPRLTDLGPIFRLLLEEVPRPRRALLAIVALTAGEVGAGLGVALAGRTVLASATGDGGSIDLRAALLAVAAAVAALVLVRARLLVQQRLVIEARDRAVGRLSRRINAAPYEDLTAVPMAALREILMTDVDFAYRFGADLVSRTVVIGMWLLASIAVIAWLSPPVLLVLALVAVITGAAVVRTLRRQVELSGPRFEALADLSQHAREVVEVERVILARQLGIGEHFVEAFLRSHRRFIDVHLAQQQLTATLRASLVGLNGLSFIAVVIAGAAVLQSGSLAASELIAILFVVSQLFVAVLELGEFSFRAAETAKAGRRLAAYWDAPEELALARGHPGGPVDRLSGHDLMFSYPGGEEVLGGVSVELRRGQLAALTGATGVGKSTFALTLAGIITPQAGSVCVDDRPVAPGEMSGCLYVGPRPVLVEGSVLDNLFLAPSDVDTDALAELFALLDGPGLPIDEPLIAPNGTGVSSGQGQLIGVARAWVRDPHMVVFDEATSALDMATEERVQHWMLAWCRARVTLVISHRRCPWTDQADQHIELSRLPRPSRRHDPVP